MQELFSESANVVWVLGTGGTISGRSPDPNDVLGYTAGEVSVQDLLGDVPVPEGLRVCSEQVAQLDSKDMSWSVWADLAQRIRHHLSEPLTRGVIVTHGTDTMEETAWCLHNVLGHAVAKKAVVLTGAMRPASAPVPDGPANLRRALELVSHPSAHGVLVCMADQVYGAEQVQKAHTSETDAFQARDDVALAQWVDGVLEACQDWPAPAAHRFERALYAPAPWVEILVSGTQSDGRALTALVKAGVQGIVLACTGNGTLHDDLRQVAEAAFAKGLPVVRATRCEHGQVQDGHAQKIPHAGGLHPVKARVSMMLHLAQASVDQITDRSIA